MEKRTICPYCGSEHIEYNEPHQDYYCYGCGNYFNEQEAQFEDVRHELSALVMDTTEDEPFQCEITIGEDEAQGLSTLELPVITGVFQDCYAQIWFNVYGMEEPMEFDDLSLDDVKEILNEVKNLKSC